MLRSFILVALLSLATSLSVSAPSNGNLVECMEEKCHAQAAACDKDKTCHDGLICTGECPEPATEECVTDCINSHMDLAMISLGACANSNGCLSSKGLEAIASKARIASQAALIAKTATLNADFKEGDLLECMEEKCHAQAASCDKDTTCHDGLTCVGECPAPVTSECATGCINSHMDLAMISLGACANAQGCLSADSASAIAAAPTIEAKEGGLVECMEEKCHAQAAACNKDKTCHDGLICTGECPEPATEGCVTDCINSHMDLAMISLGACASSQGCLKSDAVEAVAPVAVKAKEGGLVECMEEKCHAQAAACDKDKTCHDGLICTGECPEPATEECVTDCINSHMDLAMISLGACANSNGCLSSDANGRVAAAARKFTRSA